MANQRRAGLIQLKVGGEIQDAKGAFTYNKGRPKREAIIGADGVHGYKEIPQVGFIEGAITDADTLDLDKLVTGRDLTVILNLGNGKTFTLGRAYWAGEGTVNTEEAEIPVRWEGDAEEVA